MPCTAISLVQVGVEIDIFNSEDICYEEELGRGTEYIVHATTLQYNGIPMPAAVKRVLRNSEEYVDLQLEEIYLMALVARGGGGRVIAGGCGLARGGKSALPRRPVKRGSYDIEDMMSYIIVIYYSILYTHNSINYSTLYY